MDDWPTTLYTEGPVIGLARLAVRAGLRDVLRHTSHGLGISEPMAREYERRYGLPFASFGNCGRRLIAAGLIVAGSDGWAGWE